MYAARIMGRVLYLHAEDVENRKVGADHVVIESFSEMHKKWIMLDPQNNAYAEAKGIPLNALELGMTLENVPESVSFPNIGRSFRKDIYNSFSLTCIIFIPILK